MTSSLHRTARRDGWSWCLAVVILLVMSVPRPHAEGLSSEDAIRAARGKVSEGRRTDALPILEARLAESPTDTDVRLLYGLILSWEGRVSR